MTRKISFLVLVIFAFAKIQAQDYQISFAGSGETTTVETVEVENLTQGTSLTLNGTDVLHLLETPSGAEHLIKQREGLRIYPNPMTENSSIEFDASAAGLAEISVFDITGKEVISEQSNLTAGTHVFKLNNLNTGIYTLIVKSDSYLYSAKLVSQSATTGNASLSYASKTKLKAGKNSKSTKATVEMQYNTGDRLLFKATSGDYTTISTLIPNESTTVTFNFVAATDIDGNNYATVTIGSQIWMAENLRVSTYPNGTPIPHVTDNYAWSNLADNNTDDAYCFYNNDNTTDYGALYTYAAAIGDNGANENTAGQGVCPDGWHLPTDAEWTELTDYLGGTSVAGGKMKETGTAHWSSPNVGASNETGFSALAGGYRSSGDGAFYALGYDGFWWSAEGIAVGAWSRNLNYSDAKAYRYNQYKSGGFSVRCLRDN